VLTRLGQLSEGVRHFTEAARTVGGALIGSTTVAASDARPPHPPPPPNKVKLLVVGKGKTPINRPANVIFAGPMADLENAYAAADLFLFLPIYEPSANVVFEALAAGLPVITSAHNGAAELIEEGVNGSVVDDPSDIA